LVFPSPFNSTAAPAARPVTVTLLLPAAWTSVTSALDAKVAAWVPTVPSPSTALILTVSTLVSPDEGTAISAASTLAVTMRVSAPSPPLIESMSDNVLSAAVALTPARNVSLPEVAAGESALVVSVLVSNM